MNKYKKVEVTYDYSVGVINDSITVRDEAPIGRSRDDWLINLVIKAGQEMAKKHNTDLSAISFKLNKINLE